MHVFPDGTLCQKTQRVKNYCVYHYQRLQKGRDLDVPRYQEKMFQCIYIDTITDLQCQKKHRANDHGYCSLHHKKLIKSEIKPKIQQMKICRLKNCKNP